MRSMRLVVQLGGRPQASRVHAARQKRERERQLESTSILRRLLCSLWYCRWRLRRLQLEADSPRTPDARSTLQDAGGFCLIERPPQPYRPLVSKEPSPPSHARSKPRSTRACAAASCPSPPRWPPPEVKPRRCTLHWPWVTPSVQRSLDQTPEL